MARLTVMKKSILFVSAAALCIFFIVKEDARMNHHPKSIVINSTLWSMLELEHPEVEMGGHWNPKDNKHRRTISIIVPYRDRRTHLYYFLKHIHPFLQKQEVPYTIYLAEQAPGKTFNRGLVKNIGFLEASRLNPDHECTVFHDIDLLPLDDRNIYQCNQQPRHLCVAVNYYRKYTPLYLDDYARFGGVVSLRNSQFRMLNGYSNLYVGWGAEDDDLYMRLQSHNLTVLRYADHIGKYDGIKHTTEWGQQVQNFPVNKFKLLRVADQRLHRDGLNTCIYNLISVSKEKLYTRIYFDIEEDRYISNAIEEEKLYTTLYGSLSPYWRNLKFTPKPYWWKNKNNWFKNILFT